MKPKQSHVVLVHGWLLGRWMMRRLRSYLRDRGHQVHQFGYRSRALPLRQHAADLAGLIQSLGGEPVHAVGHSLGGLVIAAAMLEHRLPGGRAVFLGSPINGSSVAQRLSRLWGGKWLLGQAADALFQGQVLPAGREVGLVLGYRNLGAGRLLGARAPADGTVRVDEAQAPEATDACYLPVTHTSMVFSLGVAQEVGNFLEYGKFSGEHARICS